MKKAFFIALTVVMVFALAVPAFAAPASSSANDRPFGRQVEADDFAVRIGGNGNSARLVVYNADGGQILVTANRPANNVNNFIALPCGHTLAVFVRGNSIMSVEIVARPSAPVVVSDETVTELIRVEFVTNEHVRTEETSRELTSVLVDSNAVLEEVNFTHDDGSVTTGMGVVAGFAASAVLNTTYDHYYVSMYRNVYQTVRTIVWSDGMVETILGEEFAGEPFANGGEFVNADTARDVAASRAVNAAANGLRLAMGGGQGYPRTGVLSANGFTVTITLENQSPDVSHTFTVDIASL